MNFSPMDWSGGERLIVLSFGMLLLIWLINTVYCYWLYRTNKPWYKPELFTDRQTFRSKQKFMLPGYRMLMLWIAFCFLLVGWLAGSITAGNRMANEALANLPAVRALHPTYVNAERREITTDAFGCRATFTLEDNGNIVGPGTVQVKVQIDSKGALKCTDKPTDVPQFSE